MRKYCCLFKTIGEKRLATHLLQGLENLLFLLMIPNIKKLNIKENINKLNIEKILSLFPKDRVRINENDFQVDCTPIPFEDYNEKNLEELCLDKNYKFYQENDFSQLINTKSFLEEFSFIFPKDANSKKVLLDLKNNLKLSKNLENLYLEIISIFEENNILDLFEIIIEIFQQVGFECAKIKRIFIENGINWGYFFDHHPYLAHCNAHPNNFVIVNENYNSENILAPLDFDLTFFKNEFININYDSENYGNFDKELWDSYLKQEKFSFEFALTGTENMDNFQYSEGDFLKKFDIQEVKKNEKIYLE